jgi:hypothetical protein
MVHAYVHLQEGNIVEGEQNITNAMKAALIRLKGSEIWFRLRAVDCHMAVNIWPPSELCRRASANPVL